MLQFDKPSRDVIDKLGIKLQGYVKTCGWVYLIHAVGTNRYKVGHSINPEERVKGLNASQPPFPEKLLCKYWTLDMRSVESRLHEEWSEWKAHGEWFYFPSNGIEDDIETFFYVVAKSSAASVIVDFCKPLSGIFKKFFLLSFLRREGDPSYTGYKHNDERYKKLREYILRDHCGIERFFVKTFYNAQSLQEIWSLFYYVTSVQNLEYLESNVKFFIESKMLEEAEVGIHDIIPLEVHSFHMSFGGRCDAYLQGFKDALALSDTANPTIAEKKPPVRTDRLIAQYNQSKPITWAACQNPKAIASRVGKTIRDYQDPEQAWNTALMELNSNTWYVEECSTKTISTFLGVFHRLVDAGMARLNNQADSPT